MLKAIDEMFEYILRGVYEADSWSRAVIDDGTMLDRAYRATSGFWAEPKSERLWDIASTWLSPTIFGRYININQLNLRSKTFPIW
jgi:hypothetical protein